MRRSGRCLALAAMLLFFLLAPVQVLAPLPRQFICDSEPYSGFAQAIQTMTSDSVTEQENALLPRAGSNEMVEAFHCPPWRRGWRIAGSRSISLPW